MPSRISYAPLGVLLIGCALVATVREGARADLVAPLSTLPTTISGYASVDDTLSDEERVATGVTSYLMRRYVRDSTDGFSVYIGYYASQAQGSTIHSPKNCLPGGGWDALSARVEAVQTAEGPVTVNSYLVTDGTTRALVYYWYQGRGRIVASEYRVKWNLLRDAALTGRSEEALVRIVVPLRPSDASGPSGEVPESTAALARLGVVALVPALSRILPTPSDSAGI